MNRISEKDFQKQPLWVFITIIIVLIGSAPAFNEFILDFKPNWCAYNKWIKLTYIGTCIFILIGAYWFWHKKRSDPDPDKPFGDETFDEFINKQKRSWKKMFIKALFKEYFFNLVTLKIIPLLLCEIIRRLFVKKSMSSYWMRSFTVPETWPNYQKIVDHYFKTMFRVTIETQDDSGKFFDKTYEVKFKRDFQSIELRWNDEHDNKFQPPIQEKYENIFSKDKKDIKIFTWIIPFGLYWNLIRWIKDLLKKIKNYMK